IALRAIGSRSLVCFSHWRWSEPCAKSSITHVIDFEIAFSIQARVSIAEPGSRSALHAPPREAQNPWIIEASHDLPDRRPPTMYNTECGVIGTMGRIPASRATIPNRGSTNVSELV